MPREQPLRSLIELTIAPVWQLVRSIRQQVHAALDGQTSELRVAAAMTASELVENAIKYGDGAAARTGIHFSLAISSELLRIQIANGATNRAAVEVLQARIEEIERSADKEELFLQRLSQVPTTPGGSGNLGLYRIALEGGFALGCRYEDEVVTVWATRALR